MAKRRRGARPVLGYVTNAQGGRSQIKSPTIYNTMVENQQRIELLEQLLGVSNGERARLKAAFDELAARRLVRFLVWCRLLKLEGRAVVKDEKPVTVEKPAAVGTSEAAAAAT